MSTDRPSAVVRAICDAEGCNKQWSIAVETPVEIAINEHPFAVMLATPADLLDLAIGLAFTEGAIKTANVVQAVTVNDYLNGVGVNLAVEEDQLNQLALQRRTLTGTTGCGLCGIENLAALPGPPALRTPITVIADHVIEPAFASLQQHQSLNKQTHSVHAAAWFNPQGKLLLIREDVGRHNALDKLIGAKLRDETLREEPGFILMSSRCSYELVCKAAFASAMLLGTISAPTSLALDWAARLNLAIVVRDRDGSIVRFPG